MGIVEEYLRWIKEMGSMKSNKRGKRQDHELVGGRLKEPWYVGRFFG